MSSNAMDLKTSALPGSVTVCLFVIESCCQFIHMYHKLASDGVIYLLLYDGRKPLCFLFVTYDKH